MAAELKKLCKMLKAHDGELQCAAARVLGELRPRDASAIRGLGQLASDSASAASVYAIEALGKINSNRALPYLIPCLNAGAERRTAAAKAIAALGSAVEPALRREFPMLNTAGRIAAIDIILDRSDEFDAAHVLGPLEHNDSVEVAAHVCERLSGPIEGLTQKARDALLSKLKRFLAKKNVAHNSVAVVAGLRLLNATRHPKASPIFVEHLSEDRPPAARRHALNALSNLPLPKTPDPRMVTALLPLVSDRTYPDLVEVALRILSSIKIPASLTDEMIKLLYNRQSAVRRLAVRALSSFNSTKAAKALLACLDRNDWELGGETINALRRIHCTADLILKEIEHTEDRDRARALVAILRGAHLRASPATTKALTRRFFEMLAHHHEMSEVYFSLLSSLDGDKLCNSILSRARKLKKANKYEDAEYHLRLLTQAGPVNGEVKYELGLVRLKLSSKSLARADRLNDPALPLFAELIRDPNINLFRHLAAERNFLDLDDCYYVGFHFAEGTSIERDFATQLLHYVIRRSPKSSQSKAARRKLTAEGLGRRTARATTARSKPAARKKTTARRPTRRKPGTKASRKKAARRR